MAKVEDYVEDCIIIGELLKSGLGAFNASDRARKIRRVFAWTAIAWVLTWYPFGGMFLFARQQERGMWLASSEARHTWLLAPLALFFLIAVPLRRWECKKAAAWRAMTMHGKAAVLALVLAETLTQHLRRSGRLCLLRAREKDLLLDVESLFRLIALLQLERQSFPIRDDDSTELALPAAIARLARPTVVALAFSAEGNRRDAAEQTVSLLNLAARYLVARGACGEGPDLHATANNLGGQLRELLPATRIGLRSEERTVWRTIAAVLAVVPRALQVLGPLWVVVPVWYIAGFLLGLATSGDRRTAAEVGATLVLAAFAVRALLSPRPSGAEPD